MMFGVCVCVLCILCEYVFVAWCLVYVMSVCVCILCVIACCVTVCRVTALYVVHVCIFSVARGAFASVFHVVRVSVLCARPEPGAPSLSARRTAVRSGKAQLPPCEAGGPAPRRAISR